jgi:hypothetical protein
VRVELRGQQWPEGARLPEGGRVRSGGVGALTCEPTDYGLSGADVEQDHRCTMVVHATVATVTNGP